MKDKTQPDVLIIDDHVLFAEGLKAQLRRVTGEDHIQIEKDATRFLRHIDTYLPVDLIIMDLNMPEISGVDLITRIKTQFPQLPILVVSANTDATIVGNTLEKGAHGYVCKASEVSVMLEGVTRVLAGETYLDGSVESASKPDSPNPMNIPPRTLQVLEYMAKGHSNKAIADLLSISEATVKWHVSRLFETFSVRNRTTCVSKAVQHGLVSND